jgi:gallate decarboxylase subunit C
VLDPSQRPEYAPFIRERATTSKTIFDCTVPFALKKDSARAWFRAVDPARFAPELFRGD